MENDVHENIVLKEQSRMYVFAMRPIPQVLISSPQPTRPGRDRPKFYHRFFFFFFHIFRTPLKIHRTTYVHVINWVFPNFTILHAYFERIPFWRILRFRVSSPENTFTRAIIKNFDGGAAKNSQTWPMYIIWWVKFYIVRILVKITRIHLQKKKEKKLSQNATMQWWKNITLWFRK